MEATLTRDGGHFRLTHTNDGVGIDIEIQMEFDRLARLPQSIALSTGQRFVPFEELPAGFLGISESRRSSWVNWLDSFSPVKAAVLLVLLALGILGLRAAVPVAADLAVEIVPAQFESAIGRWAFREIEAVMLEPSQLTASRRSRIRATAHALALLGGIDPIPEIHFRHAPMIGANAFALPGGPILVTDDLVKVLGDDDKIVAVLAHEFGHVEERHGLRQVLRIGGIFLIASLVLGSDDTLMEELTALVISTTASGYSRRFERDADLFAANLLRTGGRSAGDLADALQLVMVDCGDVCRNEASWLSTHPSTESRIKVIREQR